MSKHLHQGIWAAFIYSLVIFFAQSSFASHLVARVDSGAGGPVEGAVVYATPLKAGDEKKGKPATASVHQVDKEFVDHVTVVRMGTPVYFPNKDKIRHHVYSFSQAKKFEIPLYKGMPSKPVVFDKEGPVTMGCNIHDWMHAYIYVVDTPYYITTGGDGAALLDVPAGDYDVRVWHPRLRGSVRRLSRRIQVAEGENSEISFVKKLKKVWKPRRGPKASRRGGGGYR